MESIVRNVRDIEEGDRHALEHVVGQTLRDNQRVIIQLKEIELPEQEPSEQRPRQQTIEEWTSIFDGLSEEEVEEIDRIAKTRANLTRHLP